MQILDPWSSKTDPPSQIVFCLNLGAKRESRSLKEKLNCLKLNSAIAKINNFDTEYLNLAITKINNFDTEYFVHIFSWLPLPKVIWIKVQHPVSEEQNPFH